MTHGEETGPETHQDDSIVLTYLEGLLMHQVSGGPGATATQQRCQAGHPGNQEQGTTNNKASLPGSQGQPNPTPPLPHNNTDLERMVTAPNGRGTQHLKKARLLRSETWTMEHDGKKWSPPPAESNGQKDMDDHHATSALNGSSSCKGGGESTLLASLLQSFSSRLQNVALSQQLVQSLKHHQQQQGEGSSHTNMNQQEVDKESGPSRPESASSQLKGLIKKTKAQTQINTVPYQQRRNSQERQQQRQEAPKVLPQKTRSSPSPSDSISCTDRLKAVANLVNIRSSPAPSPRPSVACSQLALLLSSEAHLQQYSREQALKAQLAGRSASERLAAMATHNKMPDAKQRTTPDTFKSLHVQNGSAGNAQVALTSNKQSPSGTPPNHHVRKGDSPRPPLSIRGRRPFERPFSNRPAQHCSSLLLQLLNNHNTQHQLNSRGHMRSDLSTKYTQGSPAALSDGGGHSSPDSSFPKDSSDAESCSGSSCSPIDLSLKGRRISVPPPPVSSSSPSSSTSSPSLDRITECLKWKTDPSFSHSNVCNNREREFDSSDHEMKPHHKVTLLQLLLDHKNNGNVNKSLDNPDLHPDVVPKVSGAPAARHIIVNRCEETSTLRPQCGLVSKSPLTFSTLSHGKDTSRASPYSLYDSSHSQSSPLDLCKNKSLPTDTSISDTGFSASILLQNLAQSGKQSVCSSPSPLKTSTATSVQKPPQEKKLNHSVTLLERLKAPAQQSPSPSSEASCATTILSQRPESLQSSSEIENLLERRTVLQLLLGNSSSKDKGGCKKRKRELGGGSCQDKPLRSPCESLGVSQSPAMHVAVKTEPELSEYHETGPERKVRQSQNTMSDSCTRSLVSVPHVTAIKQEPTSPEAAPRDGLLSHLLKQPRDVLFSTITPGNSHISVKEEGQTEHQAPTIPKKRKYSMEQKAHTTDSETRMVPGDYDIQRVTNKNNHNSSGFGSSSSTCSTSVLPGTTEVKGSQSPSIANSPPMRCSAVSDSPPGDGPSFNVLKQLLLSNNGLREFSQPTGPTGSPKHSYTFSGDRAHHQPLGHNNMDSKSTGVGQAHVLAGDPRSQTAGLTMTHHHPAPASPAWRAQGTRSPKPKVAPATSGDDEDSQPDSPRLMRSNPILYYMLQKGNAEMLRAESEQGQTACPGLQVKKEVSSERQDFMQMLNLQQTKEYEKESSHSDTHRLNGLLKKAQ